MSALIYSSCYRRRRFPLHVWTLLVYSYIYTALFVHIQRRGDKGAISCPGFGVPAIYETVYVTFFVFTCATTSFNDSCCLDILNKIKSRTQLTNKVTRDDIFTKTRSRAYRTD